jgi:hypothetical protein
MEMCNSNVHYWRTPNANRESECMHVVRAKVQDPVVLGHTPLACFMEQ